MRVPRKQSSGSGSALPARRVRASRVLVPASRGNGLFPLCPPVTPSAREDLWILGGSSAQLQATLLRATERRKNDVEALTTHDYNRCRAG